MLIEASVDVHVAIAEAATSHDVSRRVLLDERFMDPLAGLPLRGFRMGRPCSSRPLAQFADGLNFPLAMYSPLVRSIVKK